MITMYYNAISPVAPKNISQRAKYWAKPLQKDGYEVIFKKLDNRTKSLAEQELISDDTAIPNDWLYIYDSITNKWTTSSIIESPTELPHFFKPKEKRRRERLLMLLALESNI